MKIRKRFTTKLSRVENFKKKTLRTFLVKEFVFNIELVIRGLLNCVGGAGLWWRGSNSCVGGMSAVGL